MAVLKDLDALNDFDRDAVMAMAPDILVRVLQHAGFYHTHFYLNKTHDLFHAALAKIPAEKRDADFFARTLVAATDGAGGEEAGTILDAAREQGGDALVARILSGPHNNCVLPMVWACAYYSGNDGLHKTIFKIAGKTGGTVLQRKILRADNFLAFCYAAATGKNSGILHDLMTMAHECGGPRFARQMFNSSGEYYNAAYRAFLLACSDRIENALPYLNIAGQLGGPRLQRHVLRSSNDNDTWADGGVDYGALLYAVESGHPKNVHALLYATERIGGPKMALEMLCANRFLAFHNASARQTIEVISQLMDEAQERGGRFLVTKMIGSKNYLAYRNAMTTWDSQTARLLIAKATPRQAQAMKALETPEWQAFCNDAVHGAEMWQNLGGGGVKRWQATMNIDPPDFSLAALPPYRFKPKLYESLRPKLRTASAIEMCGDHSPVWAYKLSVLFSNEEEADRYLSRYEKQWNGRQSMSPVHDACLFELPEKGLWNTHEWKNLILKYGPGVSKYLSMAPEIERVAREKSIPFPRTAKEVRELAAQVTYPRQGENAEFAAIALENGLSTARFDTALDILKKHAKSTDTIPGMTIDGASIGHADYYMTRLPPGDPLGLILGELTNCCQSVGGEGEKVAVHGTKSRGSGFYVWKKKTRGEMTPRDQIIAQSWVWTAPRGVLVFDSFERLSPQFNKLVRPFLEHFAFAMAKESAICAIHLGTGGQTPSRLPFARVANPPKAPVILWSHDSRHQYRIAPVDHARITKNSL